VAVLALVAAVSGSCGSEKTAEQAPSPADRGSQYLSETASDAAPAVGGRIVYGVPAETSSFHPALASWASYSLTIARAIYDTAGVYDGNGDVQPYLAERFDHDAGYTTWTTTLRDGITYTNGKPLTAESFVAAQRAMKTSPVLAEVFDGIIGWDVTGPRTFVMHAVRPWTSFPEAMASQIGVAVDPDWLSSDDITHPVGTGPFVVDRWDLNKEMVLKKNPRYWRKDQWGNALPYLDQVTFRVVVDETARTEGLRKGELDIMMQTYATPSVAEMLGDARSGKFQAFSDKRFETP
jgi:peptide/nickel transport system substrate-binding protein